MGFFFFHGSFDFGRMEHGKLVSNPIHNIQVECEILCSIVFSLVLVILEHSFSSHYVYAFLITFDLVSHQNRDIIPDYIQFFVRERIIK